MLLLRSHFPGLGPLSAPSWVSKLMAFAARGIFQIAYIASQEGGNLVLYHLSLAQESLLYR